MPDAGTLNERKARILHVLVQHHIRTGEAVGSEVIAGTAGLGVSSATIRNELAALEEMGYLVQPHTSAGRVPTHLAYRHYVDMLPNRLRVRDAERREIVGFFSEALSDVDEILRGTTHLLSRLTHYASLALAPSFREQAIVRSELVDLGSSTLLLVVFDTGRVEKRVIDLPPEASRKAMQDVSETLASALRGSSLASGREAVVERARRCNEPERGILLRVGEALTSIEEAAEAEHVVLGGAANIVREETFRQRETLRQILEALERESDILHLLREAATTPPVTVTIGRENPITGIWEASVIAAPYGAEGGAVGTIGVVGPTRMDYAAAISSVRAVAERLSAAVEALGGTIGAPR
jgi:heat-inducible transcriptional repressor